jgi:acetylornithine deacetylase/succinyl-diaminopimelate desuccinylase-like protein
MMDFDWKAEGDRALSLLRDLIRIPTVNRGTGGDDDGREKPAAERLADFLREAKVEPRLFERAKNRTSLVARVKGTGEKAPILLNAHLDVVEADASRWVHAPFAGEEHDGWIWGRGAVDMKHMAAMSACVMAMLAASKKKLARDVIFAAVADEEAGCENGSLFLVNEHADEVRAEYALGEIGAFSQHLFGRTFYPIQVAEKGICWVRATYEGTPGHGSMPDPESAVLKLARGLERLGAARLPMHPTEAVGLFLRGLAARLPFPQSQVLKRLSVPQLAPMILDWLVNDPNQRRAFGAMLSNTASPTVLRAGSKVNVIPGRASVDIDGRTLPGQTDAAFLEELAAVLGPEAKLEVIRSMPATTTTHETPLFEHLARTLETHDPGAQPVPYMIPGFTDSKAYARLGTKCYGFSPVRFPDDPSVVFTRLYHGDNERVPADGVRWGLRVLYDAVSHFAEA